MNSIEIEIRSKHLPSIMMLQNATLPAGMVVNVLPVVERRDISETWATAIFQVACSIPAGVIAGIIINLFKDKGSTVITINRKKVELKEGEIVRIIEETTRIEK